MTAMTATRDQFHERESQAAPPVRSGEIAHTQGPWTTGGHDIKANDGNTLVGCVFHTLHEDGSTDANAIANARLIAAAPDMLAALKAITDQLERIGDTRPGKDGPFIDEARAAIAKAESRS